MLDNFLLQILANPNDDTTQPQQYCSWVGHENDCANPIHPPTPLTTTKTQQKPSGASDYHLLTTTKYTVISNNKQDRNNTIYNNNFNKKNAAKRSSQHAGKKYREYATGRVRSVNEQVPCPTPI